MKSVRLHVQARLTPRPHTGPVGQSQKDSSVQDTTHTTVHAQCQPLRRTMARASLLAAFPSLRSSSAFIDIRILFCHVEKIKNDTVSYTECKGFGFFWRVLCFYPETNTSFRTALSVNPSPALGASYVIYVILGKAFSACLQDSGWRPASILTVHAFSCWEQLSKWVFLTFWLSGEVNLSLRETLLRGGNCTSSAIALAGKGLTIETDKMLLWNHAQLHKYPEITACSGS